MKKHEVFNNVLRGGVLLLTLLVLVLAGCSNSAGDDSAKGENGETPVVTTPKGKLSDWKIVKGYENTVDESKLTIEAATDDDKGNVMKVTWSSSMDFRSCELYAMLPADEDYGVYDGIQFDVKLTASSNFLLLLRNPDGGTTVKIWEDYVYRGTDEDETVWVTVKKPFVDATDTGWGPALEGTLKEWLTADKATQKQVNLNPVLNCGGGSAVDEDQITYFDNIGFYKAGSTEAEDEFTAVWDFE